jgi:hypothetical protein
MHAETELQNKTEMQRYYYAQALSGHNCLQTSAHWLFTYLI